MGPPKRRIHLPGRGPSGAAAAHLCPHRQRRRPADGSGHTGCTAPGRGLGAPLPGRLPGIGGDRDQRKPGSDQPGLGRCLPHPVGRWKAGRHAVRCGVFSVTTVFLPGEPRPGPEAIPDSSGVRRVPAGGYAAGYVLRHRDHHTGDGAALPAGCRGGDRARSSGRCPAERREEPDTQCPVPVRRCRAGSPPAGAGRIPAKCCGGGSTAQRAG